MARVARLPAGTALTHSGAWPDVAHRSRALVAAFAFLVRNPGQWHSVEAIAAGSGASVPTIYRRFHNLRAAGAIEVTSVGGHRHFRLRDGWEGGQLAAELHRRGREMVLPMARRPAAPGA